MNPTKLFRGFVVSLLMLSQWSCAGDVDTPKARAMIEAGALVVDVRTAAEFQGGHLEGALNIPHEQIVAGLNSRNVGKDADIVVYCRSGNRSGLAAARLREAGYTAVVNGGGLSSLQP